MHNSGRWTTFASRAYYVLGAGYYLYHWLFIAGAVTPFLLLFRKWPAVIGYSIPAVSVGLLMGSFQLWRRSLKHQLTASNPCLKFELEDLTYREIDDKTCESPRKLLVRAIYPVDHYRHKFSWSGGGDVRIVPGEGIQSSRIEDSPVTEGEYLNLTFYRMLNRGESLQFEYSFELTNAKKPLKHYFGFTVVIPCETLILRVEAQPDLNVTSFRRQIFSSNRAELVLWEGPLVLQGQERLAVWEIPRPRFGFHYRISWGPTGGPTSTAPSSA